MVNIKYFRKQRGKILKGIKMLQIDPYSDQNVDGVILKFGKGEEIAVYADGNKLIIEPVGGK